MTPVDELQYVEPLTGEEIIVDLCSLIAKKLRGDCNLREQDAYSGGYYAKVQIHLECFGMDAVEVNAEIATGKQQRNPDKVEDATLEVPVEPELNAVRERSEQPVPTLTSDEEGKPQVRQRRYVRAADKVS